MDKERETETEIERKMQREQARERKAEIEKKTERQTEMDCPSYQGARSRIGTNPCFRLDSVGIALKEVKWEEISK